MIAEPMVRRDAILGCLVGGAVGDALGGVTERGRACLSDDTQLTLATCEAIVGPGLPDPARIAERMLEWYRDGRLIGIGSSTAKALRDLDAGAHWALSGARGERAAGNGAAMRVAPLAFVLDPGAARDRQCLRDACRVTHHHDEAYAGALAVVAALREAIGGPPAPGAWLRAAERVLPDCVTRDRVRVLAESPGDITTASRLGSSGWAPETVSLAILGAEVMARDGFGIGLQQLVRSSDDADTIAAIAGQVAGACLGLAEIPTESSVPLEELTLVLEIARAFADRLGAR